MFYIAASVKNSEGEEKWAQHGNFETSRSVNRAYCGSCLGTVWNSKSDEKSVLSLDNVIQSSVSWEICTSHHPSTVCEHSDCVVWIKRIISQ